MRGNTKTRPSGEKIRINIYTECKKLNMNWGRAVNTVDRIATASDGGCRRRSPPGRLRWDIHFLNKICSVEHRVLFDE